MLRLHGVVSICLSLAIFGTSAAVAQQRSSDSRLLRSVLPEGTEAVVKEPSSASEPVRIRPTTPTQRIETDARRTTPEGSGTGAHVDRNRLRSNPVRPAPAKPRPRFSRQDIAATLAALAAKAPFDLSSSGRYLVATERNGAGLVLIDVPGRRRLRRLENSNRRYALVEISADARWIAAVDRDDNGRIDLWRADNGRHVAMLKAPGGAKRKLEFSPRGNELRVTSRSGEGLVFSVPAGKVIGGAAVKKPRIRAPQFTPRIGAAPKGKDSKGEIRPAPVAVTPKEEPSAKRDAQSSPTPRIAAPEPRMAAPAPRAMMREPDEGGVGEPPAGAAPPTFFDNTTSTLPETSEAPTEAFAPSEEPPAAAARRFDHVADTLGETAGESAGNDDAEPAAESPAAPSDSRFAQRAESAAPGPPKDENTSSVTVHFATNRNRLAPKDREWLVYFQGFFSTLPAFVIYALVVLSLLIFPWFGKRSWAAYSLFTGAVVLCAMGSLEAYVRSQLRDELSGELFGSRPTELSYGTCEVSVPLPKNRQAGELNRPVSLWVFEAPENPEKHFMLRRVDEHADKEVFYKSLSARLAISDAPAALLFIHGYNVSFEDAIFRTAQLAVDLEFPGAAVTFSWPSYADPVKYTFDEQHAEVSIPALREFLKDLAARSGAESIHVIAHSMGNRVLAGALEKMDRESQEINKKVIREIVLAAPDIDRRVFESQVLPRIAENTQHCTLYASSRDRALLISRYFHNYQRLGETEPELLVAKGMDTIDASLVDTSLLGHSYIGDVQSIVSDLHDLVIHGKRPMERLGLESLRRGELMYWTLKPQLETATDPSLRR